MIPYIYIFDAKISLYKICLLLSLIIGGLVLRHILFKLNKNVYLYIVILSLVAISGLSGSHILRLIETGNYTQIFSINVFRSGLNFLGGPIFAGLILYLFSRLYKKIDFVELLAICSPPLVLGYSIGRVGCFLSGDGCYGIKTNILWGMSFPNGIVPAVEKVHPTPLYESIFCLALFFVLMKIFTFENFDLIKYRIIFITFIFLGLERFFVEFLRRNDPFYGLTQAQWISLAFIIISIPFFIKYQKLKKVI